MLFLYNLLRIFLYPVLIVVSIFSKKTRNFIFKRMKKVKIQNGKYFWIHLSSVGELNLSEKLIKKLLDRDKKILITLMTDTGMELFNKRYSDNSNIRAIYFPLDDYFCIKNITKNIEIEKLIIIETEIWPNLYNIVSKYSDLIIVNGRISDKTFEKYKKLKKIISQTLNRCQKILVQSELDLERYKKLGVNQKILKVYPNLKYSLDYPRLSDEEKYTLSKRIKKENRILITAGSTRDGEDEILIKVFKEMNKNNKYQLLLVPRHLNRVNEIMELCMGIEHSKYSENKKSDIIIVDKMGILRDIYQVSDIVFVGGTLVDIGGHSILEPLYYGKVPIIGTYDSNIRDVVENAKELDLVKIVKNEKELKNILENSFKKSVDTEEFFKKYNLIDDILNEIIEK